MAIRPTWQGHLRLSLVSCPVALYTATEAGGEVHFHMLDKDTGSRVRMVPTDPERGAVDRSDLVRGYEYEKGEYVVVSDAELAAVRLESTRTIDIERFVAASGIDRLYWDSPYFLAPDGKLAIEAFVVVREAMTRAGQLALGRVVMHQRERLLAIEPHGAGMIAWTLRSQDEVRDAAPLFEAIGDKAADAKMVAIAEQIIAQLEGPFDPAQFNDRYEDALRALIKQKLAGKKGRVRAPAPRDDGKVVDLMQALRESLGAAPKPAAKPRRRATR